VLEAFMAGGEPTSLVPPTRPPPTLVSDRELQGVPPVPVQVLSGDLKDGVFVLLPLLVGIRTGFSVLISAKDHSIL